MYCWQIRNYKSSIDKSRGHKGITGFIVDRNTPGISTWKENKMGIRTSDTCQIVFEDVRVPVENRLGEEGQFRH